MKDNIVNNKEVKVKTHIKDMKKFMFAMLIILIVLIVLILVIVNVVNKKQIIDENTNLSQLDASKYKQELYKMYNVSEAKSKFLEEYDDIQSKVAMYIFDNSTMEDDSFETILSQVKKELSKNDWSKLNIQKVTNWNGDWSIDDKGNIKFKFKVKEIEPDWINDSDVLSKIIKN